MLKHNFNKWYSLLAVLIYFIYAYNANIFERTALDYFDLIVNFGLMMLITVWIVSKSTVESILEFIILFSLILYLFVLHSYVTYVDISYYFNQEFIGNPFVSMEKINLIPFYTIYNDLFGTVVALVTIIQTIGNLFLLLPLAFALLSLGLLTNKYKVVLTIFFTSMCIEVFQFLVNFSVSGYLYSEGGYRAVDIDDVILNTAGGIVGVLIFIIYNQLVTNKITNNKVSTLN
ncbi:VanZ family protein [Bacillus sp. CHD6a]|uniref:VanZ family protein n=1 Tax=Bacillus sp. CHD6a TaxID=1643452 RepID=UPI000761E01D|nr:VanZ family protein [Bacillus sp. CHD6a]